MEMMRYYTIEISRRTKIVRNEFDNNATLNQGIKSKMNFQRK